MSKMAGSGRTMSDKIRARARSWRERLPGAVFAEANIEVTEMKRLCPVDITEDAPHPGQLRNSIHAEEPIREGTKTVVIISTGAHVADYDVHVHENPDALHPVGQWKYMEQPLNESRPHMAERIGNRLKGE